MPRPNDETTIWSRQFFTFIAVGLAVALAGLGFLLLTTRGAHLRLEGQIQKVRTQATDENNSILVVDFRAKNPSEVSFVVRSVEVLFTDSGGQEVQTVDVADVDADRVFGYYQFLGGRFNRTLKIKDQIRPGEVFDRMVMVSLAAPEDRVKNRTGLRLRITDVDGIAAELVETR
ncbi:MAG TPA: hypothetical protein DEH78_11880 [Solibacterales bacterium]|nr:hypothetical protein [Bryobacterales bacterium]